MIRELERAGLKVDAERVDTREAYMAALATNPDAILIDYSVPGFGGAAAIDLANRLLPGVALIIVTGTLAIDDPLSSVFAAVVFKDQAWRLAPVLAHEMERRALQRQAYGHLRSLETMVVEVSEAFEQTIEVIMHALDLRDNETEGHSRRVVDATLDLCTALGLADPVTLLHIRRGALLHDIGKIGVPDRILLKPGKLTDDEWFVMRRHPIYAYEWLSRVSHLRKDIDIPYYHHERWDGSGYPRGLKGEAIPLPARIFSIVDVWDAVTHPRPYRPRMPDDEARALMHALRDRAFDPAIFDVWWALTQP